MGILAFASVILGMWLGQRALQRRLTLFVEVCEA